MISKLLDTLFGNSITLVVAKSYGFYKLGVFVHIQTQFVFNKKHSESEIMNILREKGYYIWAPEKPTLKRTRSKSILSPPFGDYTILKEQEIRNINDR